MHYHYCYIENQLWFFLYYYFKAVTKMLSKLEMTALTLVSSFYMLPKRQGINTIFLFEFVLFYFLSWDRTCHITKNVYDRSKIIVRKEFVIYVILYMYAFHYLIIHYIWVHLSYGLSYAYSNNKYVHIQLIINIIKLWISQISQWHLIMYFYLLNSNLLRAVLKMITSQLLKK